MKLKKRLPIRFKGMVHDSQMNVYVLLFEGENPDLTLPVPVGMVEAMHLQMLVSDKEMPQITPRLFFETLKQLDYEVREMELFTKDFPFYHAQVKLAHKQSKEERVIATRCSDGLMLALQAQCPLYMEEKELALRGLPLTDRLHKDDYIDIILNKIKDELQENAGLLKALYGTDMPLINERDGFVDEYDNGYADGYDDGYADGFDGYNAQEGKQDGTRDAAEAEEDAQAERALDDQYRVIMDHVLNHGLPLEEVYPKYLRRRLRDDLEAYLPRLLKEEHYEKAAIIHNILTHGRAPEDAGEQNKPQVRPQDNDKPKDKGPGKRSRK